MDTDFVTALAYIGLLSKSVAEDALDARMRLIRHETGELRDGPTELAELKMIEVDYWLNMIEAEASWLDQFHARIASGSIEWIGEDSG